MAGGDHANAYDAYRQAASRTLSSDALLAMASADPARAYADAVVMAGPRPDDRTLGLLARMALAADQPKESMDALLVAHDRDPSNRRWNAALVALDPSRAAEVLAPAAETYRGRHRDEVVGAYADALLDSGSASAAFERYRQAFELDPDAGAWQRGLARADASRAVSLLEARRSEVGDRGDLLGALADAYAGAGRAAEARALYEKAVARGGGLKWYARMALVDPAGALSRLRDAASRDPADEEAWGALGDCQRLLGDADGARDAYARARKLDPASLTWALRARAVARTP